MVYRGVCYLRPGPMGRRVSESGYTLRYRCPVRHTTALPEAVKAPTQDLTFDVGSAAEVFLQWKVQGVPADITGWAFKSQVRTAIGEPVILELSSVNGKIQYVDVSTGQFKIVLTDEDTENIAAGTYVYDLFYTDMDGNEVMMMRGDFILCDRVTEV